VVRPPLSVELLHKTHTGRDFRVRRGSRAHTVRFDLELGRRIYVDDGDPIERFVLLVPDPFHWRIEFVLPGSGNDPDVPGAAYVSTGSVDQGRLSLLEWIASVRLDIAGVCVFEGHDPISKGS
jgi:hypothetical protein